MKPLPVAEPDAPNQALLFDADVFCLRCRRRLKGDRSVKRRLGPTCWRKSQTEPTEDEGRPDDDADR